MRIISRKKLKEYWENTSHKDSEDSLKSWLMEAKKAIWKTPAQIKNQYRNASILKGNRAVFNIKGNDYRLVVSIRYDLEIIFIRFIGTHKEYDKIDPEVIR